jgi:hypothetical protein
MYHNINNFPFTAHYEFAYLLVIIFYTIIYDPLLQKSSTFYYMYQNYSCMCEQGMSKRNEGYKFQNNAF